MKKILILTASPRRDLLIDEQIAKKLKELGNETKIAPCLREGRDTVLEYQPDVVVVPPVRNMYSRDFCEDIKRFGCGLVSRHTEPSCDWPDYKAMNQKQQSEICGLIQYYVDSELVWSEDEAQILNRRGAKFKAVSVGAVGVDKYLNPEYKKRYKDKAKFKKKYKFTNNKTILIQSPWGFADHSPDLRIEEVDEFVKDNKGRDRHLDMIEALHKELPDYNIIVTTHPGVVTKPYIQRLGKLGIPLDTVSTSLELMLNSDILIHAGSTMAIGAHFLKMPAFQFGDVNLKDSTNWWHQSGKIMAEMSLNCKNPEMLAKLIKKAEPKSNINKEALEKLREGRYGIMDGKATDRAAEIINKIEGKFKFAWPRSTHDYSQLTILQHPSKAIADANCGICKEAFGIMRPEYKEMIRVNVANVVKEAELVNKIMLIFEPVRGTYCPHCGSRFMPVMP
ncbi:MAG: hypothetical protein MUO31_06895 [Thermodesulfovibrionales bacterium]|nr:hypothetical protein [Thermodesulfovibrionales bacterium]